VTKLIAPTAGLVSDQARVASFIGSFNGSFAGSGPLDTGTARVETDAEFKARTGEAKNRAPFLASCSVACSLARG